MFRNYCFRRLFTGFAGVLFSASAVAAHEPHMCPQGFPDSPAISGHVDHQELVDGLFDFTMVQLIGRDLFAAKFNHCDGQGRPATTGAGDKRVADEPAFLRTSGADANSCSGCHNDPEVGGAGDFVANVFVLAQARDPVTFSISSEFSNERNTLGMHGAGPIEMLSREMTADLQSQAATRGNGWHTLTTKGVDFRIRKLGGEIIDSKGVDTDLVIKPFHQAGVVVSIREFTNNAFNHHHGMQSVERFDLNSAKGPDFDEDGVNAELSIGDITATSIFQAALGTPVQVKPIEFEALQAVEKGEQLFDRVGCTSCHMPALLLDDPEFSEPNPFNPAGNFADTRLSVRFDMTAEGIGPRLESGPNGQGAVVRAYTDLKRHNLCDNPNRRDAVRHYCNEQLDQGRPEQDRRPGSEFFLTRKLWDAGSSAPYGHRGDLPTLTEAIRAHGGEARLVRDSYLRLTEDDQAAVVNFLKSLKVLPGE